MKKQQQLLTLTISIILFTFLYSCKHSTVPGLVGTNAVITYPENLQAKSDANIYFSIKDDLNNYYPPLKIESSINIVDFKYYYNTLNESGIYDGIRLYPAFKNNHLFTVACLADTLSTRERGYILLDKQIFQKRGFLVSMVIDSHQVGLLHRNYLDSVLIDKKQQLTITDKNLVKNSRFYRWEDLLELVTDNLTSSSGSQPDSNYFFCFEIGYINSDLSARFRLRVYPQHTETQLQGFTSMVHLKDTNGVSLINPFAIYEEDNYLQRYLEVGNPCPPRCGVLHDH